MTIPAVTVPSQVCSGSSKRKISSSAFAPKSDLVSPSLTNFRHEHPLFNMSFLPNNPSSSCYESIPTSDFEAKHPCLPYGFYYDTDDLFDGDEGLLTKSPKYDPDEEWMLLGDSPPISMMAPYYGFLSDSFTGKKDGPTLAQLNMGNDGWDADDLVSIASLPLERSLKRQLSQISFQSTVSLDTNEPCLKKKNSQEQKPQQISSKLIKAELHELNRKDAEETKPVIKPEESKKQVIRVKEEPMEIDVYATSKYKPQKSSNESKLMKKEQPEESPMPSTSKSRPTRPEVSRVRNTSEGSVSSHDEGFGSQPEDGDSDDEDVDSDDESFYGDYDAKDLLGASTCDDENHKWSLNMGRTRKGGQQRFFWQYNVQSKGPKGIRIPSVTEFSADPHVLSEAKDPVFSPECQVEGVKHAGKARRGDGNDLTPNPRKLLMIGLELKKLSKTINDLTPVSDVPVTAKNKTRKEKNKLASRACRLKKKAQHEANKIKLFGLNQEHKKSIAIMTEIKQMMKKRLETRNSSTLTPIITEIMERNQPMTVVAGRTADFVNSVSYFYFHVFDHD